MFHFCERCLCCTDASITSEHKPCAGLIEGLRVELSEVTKEKDAKIEELMDHLKSVDEKLAAKVAQAAALDQKLADEKRKEAELERMLDLEKQREEELKGNLDKTRAELAKDEQQLAEDKKIFESKDAEILDLRRQLEKLQKEYKNALGLFPVVACRCVHRFLHLTAVLTWDTRLQESFRTGISPFRSAMWRSLLKRTSSSPSGLASLAVKVRSRTSKRSLLVWTRRWRKSLRRRTHSRRIWMPSSSRRPSLKSSSQ